MIKTKDIKLRPAIGKWYEYRQSKKYNTSFVFKNIEASSVNDILTLHYQFGMRLTELFKEKLSLAVEFYEVIIQQEKYSEFLEERKTQYYTYTVPATVVPEMQFIIDYPLAQAMINRATGGSGQYISTDQKLTALEEIVMHTTFEDILGLYQKLWLNLNQFNDKSGQHYSPQLRINERIKKSDEIVSLTMMVSFGEQLPAAITILFANQDFEKLVEKYQEEIQKKPKKMTVQLMPQSVSDVIVPLEVRIGTTTVAISDIMQLTPGDVFQLNERTNDNVLLKIGERAEFYGKLGAVGSKAAIQIIDLKSKYYRLGAAEQVAAAEEQPEEVIEANLAEQDNPETGTDLDESLNEELEKEFSDEDQQPEMMRSAAAAEKSDPLLKEFEHDKADDGEFVWDIDDL